MISDANYKRCMFSSLIFILFIVSSCIQKTTKVLTNDTKGKTSCDTINPSYSSQISRILIKNCISCHNADSYSVDLSTYNLLSPFIKSGKLYKHITGVRGFAQMPQDEKLSSCNIAIIRVWIKNGYKND
jgi:hypothetical protein